MSRGSLRACVWVCKSGASANSVDVEPLGAATASTFHGHPKLLQLLRREQAIEHAEYNARHGTTDVEHVVDMARGSGGRQTVDSQADVPCSDHKHGQGETA